VTERAGPVDVLVNNAAVLLSEGDDVLSIATDDYRRTFDTNVFGVIDVCRAFVPDMARRRYGRVVNVSSGAGQLARMSTYAPAYSMSKTALNAFTRILAAHTRVAECWRASSILAGCVPTWVVLPHLDRCNKAPTRSSGLRRCQTMGRPAGSFTTGARFSGEARWTHRARVTFAGHEPARRIRCGNCSASRKSAAPAQRPQHAAPRH